MPAASTRTYIAASSLLIVACAAGNSADSSGEAPDNTPAASTKKRGDTPQPPGASPGAVTMIKPVAVVYRGPGTCDAEGGGCAPAWAAMFGQCAPTFAVRFVGPSETQDVTEAALADAGVFIYPGGNDDLAEDWKEVSRYKQTIRDFVQKGGRYLGACTGGYLAGTNPWVGEDIGFGLLPGTAGEFVGSRGADIHTTQDTLVNVVWAGAWGTAPHAIYLQDGPFFGADNAGKPGVEVLATYSSNGAIAAMVATFGSGKVGVTGPHPEAPVDWYAAAKIDGKPDFKPGCDLVTKTLE